MRKNYAEVGRFRCRPCLDYHRRRNLRVRDEVFSAYGGYKCVCCKEDNKWLLQIDHINNDGADHLASINAGNGSAFYGWLRRNNYPAGFQVLCGSCNFAKGKYGSCPHTWIDKNPELPQMSFALGN